MRTYQIIVDSVFNVEKERSFSNLRRSYEQEKHRNEVQELDIRILAEKKKKQLWLFLSLSVIAVSGGVIRISDQIFYQRSLLRRLCRRISFRRYDTDGHSYNHQS